MCVFSCYSTCSLVFQGTLFLTNPLSHSHNVTIAFSHFLNVLSDNLSILFDVAVNELFSCSVVCVAGCDYSGVVSSRLQ